LPKGAGLAGILAQRESRAPDNATTSGTKPARARLATWAAQFFLPARIFYPVQLTFDLINGVFSTFHFGHLIATT
jgi:hypothetical protein